MLKVYEWIVYIIIRPYKSFQHLIKWFGIFIRAKTNYRKRKERLNRGKREKGYLLPRAKAHLAQPNSSLGFFLPGVPSSSVASSPPRTPPRPPRPLPSPP